MAKTKTSVIDLSRKLCSCPRCNEDKLMSNAATRVSKVTIMEIANLQVEVAQLMDETEKKNRVLQSQIERRVRDLVTSLKTKGKDAPCAGALVKEIKKWKVHTGGLDGAVSDLLEAQTGTAVYPMDYQPICSEYELSSVWTDDGVKIPPKEE